MLYVDSNVFVSPVIYDEEAVIEAYTSSVTWDEVVWVIRRLFGIENSVNEG